MSFNSLSVITDKQTTTVFHFHRGFDIYIYFTQKSTPNTIPFFNSIHNISKPFMAINWNIWLCTWVYVMPFSLWLHKRQSRGKPNISTTPSSAMTKGCSSVIWAQWYKKGLIVFNEWKIWYKKHHIPLISVAPIYSV